MKRKLNIISNRRIWFMLSGSACALSIIFLVVFGLRFGIDFTGGTLLEVEFAKPVTSTEIATALTEAEADALLLTDSEQPVQPQPQTQSILATRTAEPAEGVLPEEAGVVDLSNPLIQSAGEGRYLIRTKYMSNPAHRAVMAHLKKLNGDTDVIEHRYETIGPTIGETLKKRALISISLAALFIILFIAFSFRKVPKTLSSWRFGVSAVIALVHDVLITMGVFSLLGVLLHVEADTLFVTALLTVMGFSVHDTIVVFDRIREHVTHKPNDLFEEVANDAINQTLSRSINTSLTTLITLVALFLLGGDTIKWFAFALIVGITVGTYSSIFIAAPILVEWRRRKE